MRSEPTQFGESRSHARRALSIALGLAVAGLLGWLAFRRMDLAGVAAALRSADWAVLAWVPVLLLSSVFFRALRWRVLLAGQPGARFGTLAVAAGLGLGAGAILPGKLGEAVGAHALGRLIDRSRLEALGILILTRLADLLVLFALVLAASFVFAGPALVGVRLAALLFVGMTAAAFAAALLLRAETLRNMAKRFLQARLRGSAAGVAEGAVRLARGLTAADRPLRLATFLLTTAALWLGLSLSLYVTMRAFGIALSPALVPMIAALSAVGAMLPSAPGNVGTYHFFGLWAFSLAGLEGAPAAACVLMYHALDLLASVLIGAACVPLAGPQVWHLRSRPREVAADVELAPRASLAAEAAGRAQVA